MRSLFAFVRRVLMRQTAQPQQSPSADDYAHLMRRLEALDYTLTALAQRPLAGADGAAAATPIAERLDAVQQALVVVEKQFQRAGREQLKANALAEAQQEQARAALEALEAAQARHDDERTRFSSIVSDAQEGARLDLVRQLLPALDGIEEALRAGDALVGQQESTAPAATLFERMQGRAVGQTSEVVHMRAALRSWLHGLTFVRQRLLDALAAAHVYPIIALHAPFDPTLHIALHAVPATEHDQVGTVVAVLRNGYTVGTRVLRHAEVTVAQESTRFAPQVSAPAEYL